MLRARVSVESLLLLALVSGCAAHPQRTEGRPSSVEDPRARVDALARELVADRMEWGYVLVANRRPVGARYDRLPDVSPEGIAAEHKRLDEILAGLERIDEPALKGTPEQLARSLMLSTLRAEREARVCKDELWAVSPTFGWQMSLLTALRAQPVETPDERAQALQRIGVEAPRYVRQRAATLRLGLASGYRAARPVVESVLDQLDKLLATPIADSPLLSPGQRANDAAYLAEVRAAAESKLLPALSEFRDVLRKEVLPATTGEVGVSHIPHGAECYRALLFQYDGVALDPAKLHQVGIDQLEKIETEMRALSTKSFGGEPLPKLLARFRSEPRFLHSSRDEMLQQARDTVERAWAAMPRAFSRVPKSPLIVEPYAPFEERTSSARYWPASDDGKKPARYMIRLFEPEKQPKAESESIAFHEGVPGHHLQIATMLEDPSLPPVASWTRNGAFSEGWGLYAEGLADELGLYSSDLERMGMLAARAWRAARVVIDTGIHALGWDRKRAIDFLLAHASLSESMATAEIDRYISGPGQATSYMVGFMEITRLRKRAEEALGPRFDLREFHARVLEQGSPPLEVLARHIDDWIAAKSR
jgi:uncharacterized protein (DUF885 family)